MGLKEGGGVVFFLKGDVCFFSKENVMMGFISYGSTYLYIIFVDSCNIVDILV